MSAAVCSFPDLYSVGIDKQNGHWLHISNNEYNFFLLGYTYHSLWGIPVLVPFHLSYRFGDVLSLCFVISCLRVATSAFNACISFINCSVESTGIGGSSLLVIFLSTCAILALAFVPKPSFEFLSVSSVTAIFNSAMRSSSFTCVVFNRGRILDLKVVLMRPVSMAWRNKDWHWVSTYLSLLCSS